MIVGSVCLAPLLVKDVTLLRKLAVGDTNQDLQEIQFTAEPPPEDEAPRMEVSISPEDSPPVGTLFHLVHSSLNTKNSSSIASLFHFIHASSEDTFGDKQLKAIESVFYHHPKAHVNLWATNLTVKAVQVLIDQGYHLTVKTLDLKPAVQSLLEYPAINRTIVEKFLSKWGEHTKSAFWMVNHSDLMRLILLYRFGGIYLGTS